MKKKDVYKSGPCKFVGRAKTLITLFMIVAIAVVLGLVICTTIAKAEYRALFICLLVAVVIIMFTVYALYAEHISMGTVLGIEVTQKVVHVHTKRKIFTYDVKRGCTRVKEKSNRFICTFETQDSCDKFIFFKHAPLSKYSDEHFSLQEIRKFYSGEIIEKQRDTIA